MTNDFCAKCLLAFAVLALIGFALVIVSGFWRILALIVAGAAVALVWRVSHK